MTFYDLVFLEPYSDVGRLDPWRIIYSLEARISINAFRWPTRACRPPTFQDRLRHGGQGPTSCGETRSATYTSTLANARYTLMSISKSSGWFDDPFVVVARSCWSVDKTHNHRLAWWGAPSITSCSILRIHHRPFSILYLDHVYSCIHKHVVIMMSGYYWSEYLNNHRNQA